MNASTSADRTARTPARSSAEVRASATTSRVEGPGSGAVGADVARIVSISGVTRVIPSPASARAMETAVSVTRCRSRGAMPARAHAVRTARPKVEVGGGRIQSVASANARTSSADAGVQLGPGRQHQQERLPVQPSHVQPAPRWQRGVGVVEPEGEVDLVAEHRVGHRLDVDLDRLQRDGRVTGQPGPRRRQPDHRRGAEHPQPYRRSRRGSPEDAGGPRLRLQHEPRLLDEDDPVVGEHQPGSVTEEQRSPDGPRQGRHLLRHRAGRVAERDRRAAHRAVLGHGHQRAELVQRPSHDASMQQTSTTRGEGVDGS